MAEKVIVLTGITETMNALDAFDKDAKKAFERVINEELGKAKDGARALIPNKPPMSGWSTTPPIKPRKTTRNGAGWPEWSYDFIRDNIGVTKAQGKVRRNYTTSAGSIKNASASGAIFETAGRLKHQHSAVGEQFIANVNRFGPASRGIWAVVDRDGDRIRGNISKALDEAKAELQRHLDNLKGR